MKKLALALGAVAIYVLSTGCAVTDYPVITDNDQTSSSIGNHIVNTSGDALLVPDGQIVTIWSDGSDELLSFVDQNHKGDQNLTTYNNFCETGAACQTDADGDGNTDWFAGMTYLNPDHTGCWVAKAPNPNDPSDLPFDWTGNANCDGFRSLKLLVSFGSRFLEAGKDGNSGNGGGTGAGSGLSQSFSGGVSVRDMIAALGQLDSLGAYGNHPEQGLTGWKITLTPDNFEIWLDNTRLLVDGVVAVVDVRNRILAVDARTGNTADVMNQVADWVDAHGQQANLSASIAGISPTLAVGLMDSDHYRAAADRAGG